VGRPLAWLAQQRLFGYLLISLIFPKEKQATRAQWRPIGGEHF